MPVGASKTYETMAARCAACVVLGGEEQPCVSRLEIEARWKPQGKACPREVFDPSCGESAALVSIAIHADLKHFASEFWGMETRHLDDEGKDLVLGQIRAVLSDREIQQMIRPPMSLPDPENM